MANGGAEKETCAAEEDGKKKDRWRAHVCSEYLKRSQGELRGNHVDAMPRSCVPVMRNVKLSTLLNHNHANTENPFKTVFRRRTCG
jgi:hypothetical protein